jgi:signal transduction histidine kinase
MSRTDQGRIFQPGFTTKKRGWGLGLTLSLRIVREYHGGRLSVWSSEPGRGTTFRVVLKAAEG